MGSDERLVNLLPKVLVEKILSVKIFESYLTSYLSKLLVYSGIVGLLMYIIMITKMIVLVRQAELKNVLPRYYAALFVLTLFFISTYTLGPLNSISLWFIPAFLDASYIKIAKRDNL